MGSEKKLRKNKQDCSSEEREPCCIHQAHEEGCKDYMANDKTVSALVSFCLFLIIKQFILRANFFPCDPD